MKLYATLASKRIGREVHKGDNDSIMIELSYKNRVMYRLKFHDHGMLTAYDNEGYSQSVLWNEYQKAKQKSE